MSLEISTINELETIGKYLKLGEIYTGILHDLKSPITAAKCNLELYESTQNIECFNRLNQALEHMETILNCTGEIIKDDYSPHVIKIRASIFKVARLFEYYLKLKNIKLTIKVPHRTYISGSVVIFNRILMNALGNAIDAISAENDIKSILITADTTNNRVILKIYDTGVGLNNTKKGTSDNWGVGTKVMKSLITNYFAGEISYIDKPNGQFNTLVELTFNNIRS